jgi:hypothetical protein
MGSGNAICEAGNGPRIANNDTGDPAVNPKKQIDPEAFYANFVSALYL